MAQAPQLKQLWVEANPLSPGAAQALVEAAPAAPALRALGLDRSQLAGVPGAALAAAGGRLAAGAIAPGSGPGYFKLEEAHSMDSAPAEEPRRARCLVVSFGSAPGTPNWGGVLGRVRAAAKTPAEADFDVLYVVDPHRAWYRGG